MIGMVIMVSAARQAALQAAGAPIPGGQPLQALIDTGASHTCVDPIVLNALDLQPTGSVPMHTPSTGTTPMAADTYDINLVVPGPQGAIPFVRLFYGCLRFVRPALYGHRVMGVGACKIVEIGKRFQEVCSTAYPHARCRIADCLSYAFDSPNVRIHFRPLSTHSGIDALPTEMPGLRFMKSKTSTKGNRWL